MIRKELGHQYVVVAAGSSKAVMTTTVGKGRSDDKGFREVVTTLAGGASCRGSGGPPPRSLQGDSAWGRREAAGEKESRTEVQAMTSALIKKIRLDPSLI